MTPPPPSQAQKIANPRRILFLTPSSHSESTIPPLLHSLTGTRPATDVTSFAGYTTHAPLALRTKYYETDVPIWVDEIPLDSSSPSSSNPPSNPDPTSTQDPDQGQDQENIKEKEKVTPQQWKTEFGSPEAKVVRDALGAIVIVLRNLDPVTTTNADEDIESRADYVAIRGFLEAVGSVKSVMDEEGGMGEVLGMVVLVGGNGSIPLIPSTLRTASGSTAAAAAGGDGDVDESEEVFSGSWWEDRLYDLGLLGFEVVCWNPRDLSGEERRNGFGELMGMPRIKEVLETHDWNAVEMDEEEDELERRLLGLEDDDGFDLEVNELEREMVGLRFAMENGDDGPLGGEMEVESMDALMVRMKAIKDMSDELPEHERKRFAAKAVRDIMKEL
ncbi:hypothetical protein BDV25DRAFT_62687 [Aspergillus avenaceus]|uniref:Alpha and gamma adaptin binding protein p34-domain-containing protein n=1 Tax=Aspergillus avenaceus TaxID=36643 RepID=A0A5N6TI16_ASPAV|nr:hypothetical protein BDV25DRAFT_62687 [Aspergillus avenaceus]